MPNEDNLHNNAPDNSATALIIIDMINDLEFPGGDSLLEPALAAADNIAGLRAKAKQAKIPVIFANDNFGRWRSNFTDAIEHCLKDRVRGAPLAKKLRPDKDNYFILKPKHSAFYCTPLELLLQHLKCERLILCGISGNMCVHFTACDAYVRGYQIVVPKDCLASNTEEENQQSLHYFEKVLNADITSAAQLDLQQWVTR